ncbi:PREDICTED: uncharacterized protein LOC107073774, partial [Polistes dominula]|uniref:Uncharacterized protein LOC107073774 n=1 Tax=Polistes dominula TaxID=743375 RepID=A0ABM1JBX0_POLDO
MQLKNTMSSIHVDEKLVKASDFLSSTVSSVAGSSTSNNELFNTSGTSTSTSKPIPYAQVLNPSVQAFDPSDIQRSKEMSCGICFEKIMEKLPNEQTFGILPNCNHCYCLNCIKEWRKAKEFKIEI